MPVYARPAASDIAAGKYLTPAQFEARYQHTYSKALRLAKYIVGDEAHAEDVTQQAFIRAWERIDTVLDASFERWIFRIVRNLAIDHARRLRSGLRCSLDTYRPDGELFEAADLSPNPEQIALSNATRAALWKAVDALPSRLREVVILSATDEYTYEQIARKMNCPLGTVRSRLHRARVAVRRHLEQNDVPLGNA